jgi:hypothetical protein
MSLVDFWVVLTTGIYVLAGGVVGVRLLLLARRTRGYPELALGLGELLLSVAVPPLFTVIQVAHDETAIRTAVFFGHLVYTIGCAVMIVFTWQVFRPREAWGRALALGMIATVGVAGIFGVARAFLPTEVASLKEPQVGAFLVIEWVSVMGFVWTAVEAFRLHAQLRKQAMLGLADPVVVNRVLLWGVVGLGGMLAAGAPLVGTLFGVSTMTHSPTRLVCAVGTLVSSICIALAFLPTQGYLRWVRGAAKS